MQLDFNDSKESKLFTKFAIYQDLTSTPSQMFATLHKRKDKKSEYQTTSNLSQITSASKTSGSYQSIILPQQSEVKESVAHFKKYLHTNKLISNNFTEMTRFQSRNRRISDYQRIALKNRLENNILLAHEKLQQIKFGLRRFQQEKSVIIRNSSSQKSSTKSIICE